MQTIWAQKNNQSGIFPKINVFAEERHRLAPKNRSWVCLLRCSVAVLFFMWLKCIKIQFLHLSSKISCRTSLCRHWSVSIVRASMVGSPIPLPPTNHHKPLPLIIRSVHPTKSNMTRHGLYTCILLVIRF